MQAVARLRHLLPVGDRKQAMTEVLAYLRPDGDLEGVSLRQLQEFLWYELPTKWPECADLAPAIGDLFDAAGLPHHGRLCRAAITSRVHAAYKRGATAGITAFEEAKRRSGLVPPDLPADGERPAFVWGTVMGPVEAAAYESVAMVLERAIMMGALCPHTPGWRLRQRKIVARHVSDTALLDAVLTERIQRWVDSGSTSRTQAVRPIAQHLRQPVPTPSNTDAAVEPLRWLLGEISPGITLTRMDRLPRALVARGAERFGWSATGTDVLDLHEIAWRIGALRRSAHRLFLTPDGRRLSALPAALWRAAAAQLVPPDGLAAVLSELIFILLLDTSPVRLGDLATRIYTVVPGLPGPEFVPPLLQPLLRPAYHIGVVTLADNAVSLTPLGRPGVLLALQARATAPLQTLRSPASQRTRPPAQRRA